MAGRAPMTPIGTVNLVAIAVRSIDQTLTFFRDALGAEFLGDECNEELGIRFVQLRFPGLDIELMAPLRADSALDHVVRVMDNLVHAKNETVQNSENASTKQSVPLPEGLLRSRRQEEILTLILGDPEVEFPLSGLARRLGIPYSSVHREIERAERYGVVTTRRFENLRLARANVDSPYFVSLAALLSR